VDGTLGTLRPAPQPLVGWQVFPATIGSDGREIPSIRVAFAGNLDDVRAVRVQARLEGQTSPLFDGEVPYGDPLTNENPASVILSGTFAPDTDHEVRGMFIPFGRRDTYWSEWLPVKTPDLLWFDEQKAFELALVTATDEVLGSMAQQIASSASRNMERLAESVDPVAGAGAGQPRGGRGRNDGARRERPGVLAQQITTAVAQLDAMLGSAVQQEITARIEQGSASRAVDQSTAYDDGQVDAQRLTAPTVRAGVLGRHPHGRMAMVVNANGHVTRLRVPGRRRSSGTTFTVAAGRIPAWRSSDTTGGAAVPVFAIANVDGYAEARSPGRTCWRMARSRSAAHRGDLHPGHPGGVQLRYVRRHRSERQYGEGQAAAEFREPRDPADHRMITLRALGSTGVVAIYEGADDLPFSQPLNHLSNGRLKFHSSLSYPKVVSERAVSLALPARTSRAHHVPAELQPLHARAPGHPLGSGLVPRRRPGRCGRGKRARAESKWRRRELRCLAVGAMGIHRGERDARRRIRILRRRPEVQRCVSVPRDQRPADGLGYDGELLMATTTVQITPTRCIFNGGQFDSDFRYIRRTASGVRGPRCSPARALPWRGRRDRPCSRGGSSAAPIRSTGRATTRRPRRRACPIRQAGSRCDVHRDGGAGSRSRTPNGVKKLDTNDDLFHVVGNPINGSRSFPQVAH
jgi:hypothetical protein